MASKATASNSTTTTALSAALFLLLNLLFFAMTADACSSTCPTPITPKPPSGGRCPIDTLKLVACANVLDVLANVLACAIEKAERDLLHTEETLQSAEAEKVHYEGVMNKKVLHDIKQAEEEFEELQKKRQESFRKASIICPECEIEALGDFAASAPEQLSAQVSRLKQRLQHESQRYTESIDELRALYQRKERKIMKKQQTYSVFREKLNACHKALDLRWNKYQRNATLLKRQLTWHMVKAGEKVRKQQMAAPRG